VGDPPFPLGGGGGKDCHRIPLPLKVTRAFFFYAGSLSLLLLCPANRVEIFFFLGGEKALAATFVNTLEKTERVPHPVTLFPLFFLADCRAEDLPLFFPQEPGWIEYQDLSPLFFSLYEEIKYSFVSGLF